MSETPSEFIRLKGIRQNNLKGFDLDIPLGKLIAVTGLSGSGKSSLVFETLHAEGQRRYVETFSPYTRQFMEIMDRPHVDSIDNIRPSIAIQQSNTVKTSRSTVGTMTELCDFFKVWFCHVSSLYDPQTGEKIEEDTPQSLWKKASQKWPRKELLLTFEIKKPASLQWDEILEPLQKQGYTRCLFKGEIQRMESLTAKELNNHPLFVIQDRLMLYKKNEARFVESAATALHFGHGELHVSSLKGKALGHYSEGLHSPKSGLKFEPSSPALFSFNSPIGACPKCRGFGRVVEIDYNRVIPDKNISIENGAIRAFHGDVYSECLNDLLKYAPKLKIRTNIPWKKLTDDEKNTVIYGDPHYNSKNNKKNQHWYGIKGFFDWLESKTYKMHIRFLLSKYRSYTECPDCHGGRLNASALNWKWHRHTLPDLYNMSVEALFKLMKRNHKETGNHPVDLAAEAIIARLNYLVQVGLGYLTLNRTSRTLSGGEVERVNLTTCLGTSLVETLFVLDEPSIGLHSRDINRLINILKHLTSLGNTVIVVEHDESIMRAADRILELGPRSGNNGGHLTFQGTASQILKSKTSLTGAYLSGKKQIDLPDRRRRNKFGHHIEFKGASKNNIRNLNFKIPLKQFVCISGVSGSGKSTLMDNIIYQGLMVDEGKAVDDPATIQYIKGTLELSEIAYVDQSPISKTPRSNPALYAHAWDGIRQLFAMTDYAITSGMSPSSFSFNTGKGRCDYCHGLGHERVEMQFLSDVYVTCPICEGRRFNAETLSVRWKGYTIADILDLSVKEAIEVFLEYPKIRNNLQTLESVGLDYLTLGQPLNTLSGGECQRLKLVKYLTLIQEKHHHAFLLLDEPTTGLHREDIKRLIVVLQQLVDHGHSLLVIEHQLDILKSADWIIEMGPDAGNKGGKIIAEGTPEELAQKKIPSAPFLKEALMPSKKKNNGKPKASLNKDPDFYKSVRLTGAREHNLKNLSVAIPHRKLTVLTGVSGSGKSSLAFDIIFAEGQRRFMESISAYARQFVEQLPRPDIDMLTGIAPTVAIEQRVTQGSQKSTVATITEVAQYLRLLFARIGIQHSPTTGQAVVALSTAALVKKMENLLANPIYKEEEHVYLCAPIIRSRKGHHQPVINWASSQGHAFLRINGKVLPIQNFTKLDRYREHDIEIVTADFSSQSSQLKAVQRRKLLEKSLDLGKGSCFLASSAKILSWFSTTRTDPTTGEAFPELDPKHFSWNSPRGWCITCRGHGHRYHWMNINEEYPKVSPVPPDGSLCPDCQGGRLNPVSRAVKIFLQEGSSLSLPELLAFTPSTLLATLDNLELDERNALILQDLRPQIKDRLQFMEEVGLNYLTLNRSSKTLSGGEAQRIRLAAQLSSNLSGVLYVLDEPSIGLHTRDNIRLIQSLKSLRDKGNTLLVVEHDDAIMYEADNIIDLGPAAGIHGGEVIAKGSLAEILRNKNSLTGHFLKKGIPHPLKGDYRKLPKPWTSRQKTANWLVLKKAALRNLKGEDLYIPLQRLTLVCGISGAGKSTLIRGLLKPCVEYAIKNKKEKLDPREIESKDVIESDEFTEALKKPFEKLINGNAFKKVIEVDQKPIGKTPRSTPATYIKAFDIIRNFFASLPESKIHGFAATHFSFNTKGGRCEKCKGAGRIKLEMNFLPDTYVSCEACEGTRYGPELSEIRWKDKNISEILDLSFEEATEFFSFHTRLKALMELMVETGLGYLTLGQSSPTLSGGEAQRLKLVSELTKGLPTYKEKVRNIKTQNLYILEEPTIGLHLSDCERLIHLLHRLVDQGHTVIVVEHHLDLIAEGDYLVEVGPEGGQAGGYLLYQGPPQKILTQKSSPTAPFLKDKLK